MLIISCVLVFPLSHSPQKTISFLCIIRTGSDTASPLLISVTLHSHGQCRNMGQMVVWLNGITDINQLSPKCIGKWTVTLVGSFWWWATLLCSWSSQSVSGRHRRSIYQVIGGCTNSRGIENQEHDKISSKNRLKQT